VLSLKWVARVELTSCLYLYLICQTLSQQTAPMSYATYCPFYLNIIIKSRIFFARLRQSVKTQKLSKGTSCKSNSSSTMYLALALALARHNNSLDRGWYTEVYIYIYIYILKYWPIIWLAPKVTKQFEANYLGVDIGTPVPMVKHYFMKWQKNL